MRFSDSDASPGVRSECATSAHGEALSPYALAQDGLAELIEASVQAQRIEAMNAAMRVELIYFTVSYAVRSEEAFVAPTVSPQRRREMAHRSVTAELATALHVPERTMERQISDAWALATRLPVTLSALRNGEISLRHATVIVEETTDLDDPGLRARLDEQLAAIAATETAATVRRKARALREDLSVQTVAERHRAARAERRVELEPSRDGMSWLHALLPATDASLIKDRLDRIASAAAGFGRGVGVGADGCSGGGCGDVGCGGVGCRGGGDPRGADQLRADATRDLLLHGALPARTDFAEAAALARPTVHVTVPVLTLMGASEQPGLLDGYGPIDADSARRLAALAPSFTRLLTHPVSGTVLDVDRTSYRPPAGLKRWLEVRDGTCRFPGCNRRAAGCEVDHTVDWQHDGRTAFDNLAHLCGLHHHLKHETSWSVRHLSEGSLEWRSPAGRKHVTHPGRRIPGSTDSIAPPGREAVARRTSDRRPSDQPTLITAGNGAELPTSSSTPEPPPPAIQSPTAIPAPGPPASAPKPAPKPPPTHPPF